MYVCLNVFVNAPYFSFVFVCLFLCSFFHFLGEIKKYLDEAEEDKKRYIEELKIYQQSEQYQAFMKRQNAKKIKNIVGKMHFIYLNQWYL